MGECVCKVRLKAIVGGHLPLGTCFVLVFVLVAFSRSPEIATLASAICAWRAVVLHYQTRVCVCLCRHSHTIICDKSEQISEAPWIPIWERQQQQKAVHWAERLTASAQGLTVNSCAWCTQRHTHRLAHMCKGEERESERESRESPSCLRAVSQQGSQKYRVPLLHWTLAYTSFWAYPSQWYQHVSVCVCLWVIIVIVCALRSRVTRVYLLPDL